MNRAGLYICSKDERLAAHAREYVKERQLTSSMLVTDVPDTESRY